MVLFALIIITSHIEITPTAFENYTTLSHIVIIVYRSIHNTLNHALMESPVFKRSGKRIKFCRNNAMVNAVVRVSAIKIICGDTSIREKSTRIGNELGYTVYGYLSRLLHKLCLPPRYIHKSITLHNLIYL